MLSYLAADFLLAHWENRNTSLVLVGYMLSTFVPEMYSSGKPLLWELFDVRIP